MLLEGGCEGMCEGMCGQGLDGWVLLSMRCTCICCRTALVGYRQLVCGRATARPAHLLYQGTAAVGGGGREARNGHLVLPVSLAA